MTKLSEEILKLSTNEQNELLFFLKGFVLCSAKLALHQHPVADTSEVPNELMDELIRLSAAAQRSIAAYAMTRQESEVGNDHHRD